MLHPCVFLVAVFYLIACSSEKSPTALADKASIYAECATMPVDELLDDVNTSLEQIKALYKEHDLYQTERGKEITKSVNEIYELVYERRYELLVEACQCARELVDSMIGSGTF